MFKKPINQIDKSRYLGNIESWYCLDFFFRVMNTCPFTPDSVPVTKQNQFLAGVPWKIKEFIGILPVAWVRDYLQVHVSKYLCHGKAYPAWLATMKPAMLRSLEFSGQWLEHLFILSATSFLLLSIKEHFHLGEIATQQWKWILHTYLIHWLLSSKSISSSYNLSLFL